MPSKASVGASQPSSRRTRIRCHALRGLVAPLARNGTFFVDRLICGSHRGSLAALQSGAADIAAIDCVSLAGFRRHDPDLLRGLRVVFIGGFEVVSADAWKVIAEVRKSANGLACASGG